MTSPWFCSPESTSKNPNFDDAIISLHTPPRSKKQAKHAAALQCLQSGFIQIKDTSLSQQAMQVKMMENIDFTSDETSDQKGTIHILRKNHLYCTKLNLTT
jgi:hypothetical protein